jgi:hypothetical protein
LAVQSQNYTPFISTVDGSVKRTGLIKYLSAVDVSLKKKDLYPMNDVDNCDFLKKYRIEFPSVSSLTVLHAEPVSITPGAGYTFSDKALHIISDLVAPSKRTAVQFNRIIASCKYLHQQILFFFDGPYQMAHHIFSVRDSISEIAMISCVAAGGIDIENPPVGLLYVEDVPTLTELAQRSPFLGQLLPIADGPPDGAIWAYFLGKAEQMEIDESESVEAPKEKDITQLVKSIH